MASDLGQHVRKAIVSVLDDSVPDKAKGGGALSGGKGVAAGAGLAMLAPLAGKGAAKLAKGKLGPKLQNMTSPKEAVSDAGSKIGDKVKESVGDKVDEAGGAGGMTKQAVSGMFGGGDGDGGGGGASGTGSGRRMPVQQSMDVAVPVQTAYNQWTQFEEWPSFMHRLEQVDQKDDCTVSFGSKIWGINKTFEAEIIEQYPDERIKWEVVNGPQHVGVVTFHPIGERLTRIELNLDVDPDSLLEKAGRGMRFVKRAVRADMHRLKAFLEMNDEETGAWRGTIEDGEVVESHEDAVRGEEDQDEEQQHEQGQGQAQPRRRAPGGSQDQDEGHNEGPRPPRPPRAPVTVG